MIGSNYFHHSHLMYSINEMICDLKPDCDDWRKWMRNSYEELDERITSGKLIKPDILSIYDYSYYEDLMGHMLLVLPEYHPLIISDEIVDQVSSICLNWKVEKHIDDLCFLINHMLERLKYLDVTYTEEQRKGEIRLHKEIEQIENAIALYENCTPEELNKAIAEINNIYDTCQMVNKKDLSNHQPHEALEEKYELLKLHLKSHFTIMENYWIYEKPTPTIIGNRHSRTMLRLLSLFCDYVINEVTLEDNSQSNKYRFAGNLLDQFNIIDEDKITSEMDDYLRSRHKTGSNLFAYRLFG